MSFHENTVAALTGISRSRLRSWAATGFIRPSLRGGSGRGDGRRYSFTDVVRIKVAKLLMDRRLPQQERRAMVRYLGRHLPDDERALAGMWFLSDGDALFVLAKDRGKVLEALGRAEMAYVFPIGKIAGDLKCAVEGACRERACTVTVRRKAYDVVLHPDAEAGGFCVSCPSLQGCDSQGDSEQEALEMIRDAIDGHLAVAAQKKRKQAVRT